MSPQTVREIAFDHYERAVRSYNETAAVLGAELASIKAASGAGALSDLRSALGDIPAAFDSLVLERMVRDVRGNAGRTVLGATIRDLRDLRTAYMAQAGNVPDATKIRPGQVGGSRETGARHGYFEVRLHDGSWGALQRREDDCVRAGLASLLQAPMSALPRVYPGDLFVSGVDEDRIPDLMAEAYAEWMARNGVALRVHSTPPTSSRRWLAVAGEGEEGHCVLMDGRNVILDTGWVTPPPVAEMVNSLSDSQIADGFNVGFTVE